ncbi:MAG: peptidylprolyl isomerase, partial [bacterium]
IIEVMVDDGQLAKDLYQRVIKGEDISSLARRYTQREKAKGKGGRLGPFKQNDYGPVSRKAFELKVGEVTGPIKLEAGAAGSSSQKTFYSVFKLVEKTEERVKPFDEVRSQLESDLRFQNQQAIRKAWENELRNAYKVRIDEGLVARIWPLVEPLPESAVKERKEWRKERAELAKVKEQENKIKLKLKPGTQEITTKEGKKIQVKIGEPRYIDKEGKEKSPGRPKLRVTPKSESDEKSPSSPAKP